MKMVQNHQKNMQGQAGFIPDNQGCFIVHEQATVLHIGIVNNIY